MSAQEALNLLENTCLSFMVHIPRETRSKVLEAAEIIKSILDDKKEEKKDD